MICALSRMLTRTLFNPCRMSEDSGSTLASTPTTSVLTSPRPRAMRPPASRGCSQFPRSTSETPTQISLHAHCHFDATRNYLSFGSPTNLPERVLQPAVSILELPGSPRRLDNSPGRPQQKPSQGGRSHQTLAKTTANCFENRSLATSDCKRRAGREHQSAKPACTQFLIFQNGTRSERDSHFGYPEVCLRRKKSRKALSPSGRFRKWILTMVDCWPA
jgi:hypothetical protein